MADITPSHIVRLEGGRYGASLDILSQIAVVFGLEVDLCEDD